MQFTERPRTGTYPRLTMDELADARNKASDRRCGCITAAATATPLFERDIIAGAFEMLEEQLPCLRIFADESVPEPIETNLNGFAELAGEFAALTGWTLAYRETVTSRIRREGVGCRNLPFQARLAINDLSADAMNGTMRAANREKCDRLVSGLNSILEDLDQGREEIWRKNAELATGIPVTDDGSASEKLAILLNSLLTSAVDVTNAKKAALYLLDDGTQNLNLRTHVGFGQSQGPNPSRDLSRAKADLEALLGNVVVMEDSSRFTSWDIPAECGAAICVPISSANNLLGSLWIFDVRPRDFTGIEANMVEIIAGRIAAELERITLLHVARQTKLSGRESAKPVDAVSRPQLPNIHPPIDELRISGSISKVDLNLSAGAVYDWAICQRGRLAFLVAHAGGSPNDAARVATILQTAFRAHSAYCSTALQLFDCVFETSMSVDRGDNPVRFSCGYIEPGIGRCELASTEEHSAAISVIDDEFQVQVRCNPIASGEFGLAHLATITLEPADELIVAIANPIRARMNHPGQNSVYDASSMSCGNVSTVAATEIAAMSELRIKRI